MLLNAQTAFGILARCPFAVVSRGPRRNLRSPKGRNECVRPEWTLPMSRLVGIVHTIDTILRHRPASEKKPTTPFHCHRFFGNEKIALFCRSNPLGCPHWNKESLGVKIWSIVRPSEFLSFLLQCHSSGWWNHGLGYRRYGPHLPEFPCSP